MEYDTKLLETIRSEITTAREDAHGASLQAVADAGLANAFASGDQAAMVTAVSHALAYHHSYLYSDLLERSAALAEQCAALREEIAQLRGDR